MGPFLSLFSFVSAVTLLGNPVEVYFYGQQYTVIALAFIPMTAALAYLYVPTFFELQLTSAYEVEMFMDLWAIVIHCKLKNIDFLCSTWNGGTAEL